MRDALRTAGRAVLVILGAITLSLILGGVVLFDVQKIVTSVTAGRFPDPVSQFAYTFRLLGALDDFLVTPIICLCVGAFVGLFAKRVSPFLAVLSILPTLYARLTIDSGQNRAFLLALAAAYLVLAVLSSHFVARFRERSEQQLDSAHKYEGKDDQNDDGTSGATTRRKKKSRRKVRA